MTNEEIAEIRARYTDPEGIYQKSGRGAELPQAFEDRIAAGRISGDQGGDAGLQTVGSHTQLVTALGNLLENAIAYSGEGTRVAIGVRRRRDQIEIAVERMVRFLKRQRRG